MKDLAHHMKKLNRLVVRSTHREEMEEEAFDQMTAAPPRKQTSRQIKKQTKSKLAKARKERTPTPLTAEEKNKKMTNRVPVFDRLNDAQPKRAKASRKKTPRI